MKQEYQDQIDKYVLGRMDDTEKAAFEREVAQNIELQEQLRFTQDVASATKSREAKLARMEEWEDDYVFEKGRGGKKQVLYWISGIAAIFIAGFFITNTMLFDKGNGPYSESQSVYGSMRGGMEFSDIDSLIFKGRYETALPMIEKEEMDLSTRIEILKNDSTYDADRKEYELQLIELKTDELNWLRARTLIGLGRIDEALLLLGEIRTSNSEYRQQADSLYNSIKR